MCATAGAVFVGRWSPVGDYATGANHVLPTGGRARAVGGLGLETFLKPVTVQRLTSAGLARVRPVVESTRRAGGMPHTPGRCDDESAACGVRCVRVGALEP